MMESSSTAWVEVAVAAVVGVWAGWLLASQVDRRHSISNTVERPILAVVTGTLCGVMAARFDSAVSIAAHCLLCAGLVVLSAIDLHTHRLPREISFSTLAAGAPLLAMSALVEGEPHRIVTMVIGATIALAAMLGLYTVSRGGLGDGDVRMSPLLGAYLGWTGIAQVPIGLFLGFVFGAAFGVVAIATGAADRKTVIPFGPFLAAGTVVALVFGQQIIDVVLVP